MEMRKWLYLKGNYFWRDRMFITFHFHDCRKKVTTYTPQEKVTWNKKKNDGLDQSRTLPFQWLIIRFDVAPPVSC